MKQSLIALIILSAFGAVAQTDVLLTDFQTGMPANYTVVDNDGLVPAAAVAEYTEAWITILDPENPLDTIAASTSYFDPSGTASRWLITPPLVLGTFGNFVEWQAKSQDASFPDDYLVLVSTTDDQITSFTDTIGHVIEENFEWTLRTVNLSDKGYDGQTIYLAFVNVTEDGFKLYIDDIRVWKDDASSVAMQEDITLSVYPNPAHDLLYIKSDAPVTSCQIFSAQGNKLTESATDTISVSHLPGGVYLLKVITQAGTRTVRFVKN